MGTSTDSILFFGITAEEPVYYRDLAEALGVDLVYDDENDIVLDEEGNEMEDWDIIDYVLSEHLPEGCAHSVHCSDKYSIPYIYAEEIVASRGYPKEIMELPEIPTPTVKALAKLAEKLDWLGPNWYLASWWG